MSNTAIKKPKGHFARNWFFYFLILTLAVGITGLYFYDQYQLNKKVTEAETAYQTLQTSTSTQLDMAHKNHLTLTMQSLVWMIRGETMENNSERIKPYFLELLQNVAVQELTLFDKSGNVIETTNEKRIGQNLKDWKLTDIETGENTTPSVQIITKDKEYIGLVNIISDNQVMSKLAMIYKPK